MGEERRVWFDASAYMLFEASGDSDQAGYYDGALFAAESDAAEDDAQSTCSYGSSVPDHDAGGADARMVDAVDHRDNNPDFDVYSKGEEEVGGDREEEDGVVDQWCGGRKQLPPPESKSVVAPGNREKRKKSSKACEELMNERERDRLFWEACLAS